MDLARNSLYVIALLVFAGAAQAQVPFDLAVRALAATPGPSPTFYVGTDVGLFSGAGGVGQLQQVFINPAGTNQPPIADIFLDAGMVHVFARNPFRGLITPGDGEDSDRAPTIWTSRDAGQTWTETTAAWPADFQLSEVRQVVGGKLFAVVRRAEAKRLYVSTDGAETWTYQADFPTSTDVIGIHYSMPDLIYATVRKTMRRTIDGGQTWATVSTLPIRYEERMHGTRFIAPNAQLATNVLIGGGGAFSADENNGVWISNDQGQTWEQRLNANSSQLRYKPDLLGYFHLDSTPLGEVDVSFDQGRTWRTGVQFSQGDLGHSMTAVTPDPRNDGAVLAGSVVAGGTGASLFHSADSGINWTQLTPTTRPTIGGPVEALEIELPSGAPARAARLPVRTVETDRWELEYTVEDPGVSWIRLGATGGTTGQDDGVDLTVDPAGLPVGEYTADVTVVAPTSSNQRVTTRLTLHVTTELTGPQPRISTFAGNGDSGPEGYGGSALEAELASTQGIAFGPDGSLYLAAWLDDAIDRITPMGVYERFAGTGEEGFAGDGGPAIDAQFDGPDDVAVAADGTVYVAEFGNRRVRRIDPRGVITTVVGNGELSSPRPDASGPDATAVALRPAAIAVDEDGLLYVAAGFDIYRVTSSGAYSRFAQSAAGGIITGMHVGADGSVYVTSNDDRVWRVRFGRARSLVAGTGAEGYTGDGGPADQATLNSPRDVAVGDDGTIYVSERDNHVIRAVNQAGVIRTIAGNGSSGFAGDGGPALLSQLSLPRSMAWRDGQLYFAGLRRIRVINFDVAAENPQFSAAGVVNAGSFASNDVAPGENISVFGVSLAFETVIATETPLPEELAGVRVTITDSAGETRPCALFFVAGTQINCNLSDETALGEAMLRITTPSGTSTTTIQVTATAPGLFTANATGSGVTVSIAIRVAADGTQSVVDVIDTTQQPFTERAIDLGPEGEQVVLLLYGTGIRGWSDIRVTIGGQQAQVIGVAPQGEFVGLDQVNVIIPRSLIGAGVIDIRLVVDGREANVVTLRVQ